MIFLHLSRGFELIDAFINRVQPFLDFTEGKKHNVVLDCKVFGDTQLTGFFIPKLNCVDTTAKILPMTFLPIGPSDAVRGSAAGNKRVRDFHIVKMMGIWLEKELPLAKECLDKVI